MRLLRRRRGQAVSVVPSASRSPASGDCGEGLSRAAPFEFCEGSGKGRVPQRAVRISKLRGARGPLLPHRHRALRRLTSVAGRAIGLAKDPSVEHPQTGLFFWRKLYAEYVWRVPKFQIFFSVRDRIHPRFGLFRQQTQSSPSAYPARKSPACSPAVRANERKTTMADTMTNRGLTPGARRRIKRFYEQIDRNLAAWERLMFPKKKRRRGKRKRGRRRNGKVADLLGGREVRHGA